MTIDVEELLSRGVEKVIPRELAEKKLNSGEKLRIYHGVDPTGAKLHLGHSVPLRKLKAFADAGHEVIFIVGSFTAMIGDPTGRDTMRSVLTREEVEKNFKTYKEQAGKILDISKIKVRYNHEWLEKLDFKGIVDLASNFTVQQMLQRDMFDKRLKENKPISVHEFLYPLMVGYDSVVLDVDGELGGSDQEFNMLAGRTLQAAYHKRDKFVLTTKLIEGTDGRKMSKTYDNSIYLEDSAEEMYGKLMSIRDELVEKYFECLTSVPMGDVINILSSHPKDAKMRLSFEITKIYHGEEAAKKAQENFEKAFSKGGIPDDIKTVTAQKNEPLVEILLREGLVSSKTEFNRLEKDGAIEEMESGVYRIGKHRFLRITRSD
ncbi:MAG: tyrosine--tRNA ligase [Candidatus Zambryskibacteria bacterium RIFCSPLOWO2_02_FULL_51_21]|uniref:Tyrosine--tRNA ligase n=1 Tax=Candidatus Zambryskibacteria bacterium RIFCSPHIGHO2_02_FULL_43_37 TaxID=1802749 RepID=A0A1G2TI46_9BACT|nr:MAG: tyrosine--tRNA ligase [Candidatus Zambryskibacteria bacterium RIFCSPHIGHO2_01_FULL_52_18]OHA96339.1 MAG: tyrosine--tRNA ligase [Candidatus Zambryskibacteria bacterium RIFCSPHIGHO2_02_FULL_43_37]OHB07742.1 MAG: tyrosine--tRNA ligase [Candidatus Zambryskibacteria bacterium RIFCSPLOWO2_01_FULL_52_12]OHB11401.1 MAG: tyrosine--tRNA ligase [Candidatus Zambryskibacteria bacterium RIFCSPLOWO2_02_FULL_51_21]